MNHKCLITLRLVPTMIIICLVVNSIYYKVVSVVFVRLRAVPRVANVAANT